MTTDKQRQERAINRYIQERAKRLAFDVRLPSSVNELAGLLAGFAMAIHNDVTPGFVRGYMETLTCTCVPGEVNAPDCPKHGDR